ncbi:MAG: thiopurine S-methyltransferase [Verrucomicrobia bacterium]|nr:MAG: thiopurine S-methyltransferase [Verrucomicrobiota bacterium]
MSKLQRNKTDRKLVLRARGGGTQRCAGEQEYGALFAKAGFRVFGYDIAPSAIRLSVEQTQAAGLQAEFQLADFLRDPPPVLFDWIFEHTLFCAIQLHERDDYVRAVLRWLKPEGQYLAVNYLIPDKDGPPFGTTRDELWQRFSPHFELLKEWVPRSYPNRTGLELMLWWQRKPEGNLQAPEK